jgi:uncharacterized protein YbjT (DUF2867 family)
MPTTPRVAVVGASGKTGQAVRAALDARGADVVPIGRAAWPRLTEVLAGCHAGSLIAPNLHPDEPAFVAAVLAAAAPAGVGRVAYHSVATPYAPAMPHHLGKARAEDLVRRTDLAWTILQPCAYVQNLLPVLRSGATTLEVPYDVRRPFGLVDVHDVAEATAAVLLDASHAGATYELGGPALVSVADVAATAGAVTGRPIVAARQDPEAWAAGPGAGLDPRERDWLLAMFAWYDAHGLPAGGRVLAALLGRPATTLRETLERELCGV